MLTDDDVKLPRHRSSRGSSQNQIHDKERRQTVLNFIIVAAILVVLIAGFVLVVKGCERGT